MAAMMGCCVLPLFALTPKNKTMKELDVKKVSMANIPVEVVPALLDEEKVAFQPISTVNWAAYPYCPDVKFRIAHTDNAILIHYKVKEASVRAVAGKDNGPVWEDACVEFFSILPETEYITIWNVTVRGGCLSAREPDAPIAGMRRRKFLIKCNVGLPWGVRILRNG